MHFQFEQTIRLTFAAPSSTTSSRNPRGTSDSSPSRASAIASTTCSSMKSRLPTTRTCQWGADAHHSTPVRRHAALDRARGRARGAPSEVVVPVCERMLHERVTPPTERGVPSAPQSRGHMLQLPFDDGAPAAALQWDKRHDGAEACRPPRMRSRRPRGQGSHNIGAHAWRGVLRAWLGASACVTAARRRRGCGWARDASMLYGRGSRNDHRRSRAERRREYGRRWRRAGARSRTHPKRKPPTQRRPVAPTRRWHHAHSWWS